MYDHVYMVDIVYSRNSVHQTAYHVVWCPKYRKAILVDKIAEDFSRIILAICEVNGWTVITKEIQPDHIHLSVSIPPSIAVSDAVKILKGSSARKLFLSHPELKKTLWGLTLLV